MELINLTVGDTLQFKGCFTHEEWLIGKNPSQIATELGLRQERVALGIYILWAKTLPQIKDFWLGGYAKVPTSDFMSFHKGKARWSWQKFNRAYNGENARLMPMTISEARNAWLTEMKRSKLVKVVPVIKHTEGEVYPSGKQAPQIYVHRNIECIVATLLEGSTAFNGVFG